MSEYTAGWVRERLSEEGLDIEELRERWDLVARYATETARQAFDAMAAVMRDAAIGFERLYAALDEAGMVPPRHPERGDRWTSPVDGIRYKAVGGKRGKPVHWQEIRGRWWL